VDVFTVLKIVGCKPQQMNNLFICVRICVDDLLIVCVLDVDASCRVMIPVIILVCQNSG
jgi:hypothetical protein